MADLSILTWDVIQDTILGNPGPWTGFLDDDGTPNYDTSNPIPNGAKSNLSLLAQVLRSENGPPVEFRVWLADLFDPNSKHEYVAVIKKRRRGAHIGRGLNPIDVESVFDEFIQVDGTNRKTALDLTGKKFGCAKRTIEKALSEAKRFREEMRAEY